jgi:AcrR family transcriptional regulator
MAAATPPRLDLGLGAEMAKSAQPRTIAGFLVAKRGWVKRRPIAGEAGVSIGSLYQYYPGKEALVAAVIDRHNRDIMKVVRRAFAEVASQPVEKAVRRLVAVAIEAHRIDPRLHRGLAEQIPRTGRLENVEVFNHEAHALFKSYLEDHRDELRVDDLAFATFICATSIEALAHTAVLHSDEVLSDEAIGTLIDEAMRLVVGYLQ